MNRFLLWIASALFFASCGEVYVNGEGNTTTKEFSVGNYSAIDISAPIQVEILVQEGAPSVSISGYENLLKHIIVTTKDNELHIEVEDGVSVHSDQPLTAVIQLPQLKTIDLSGAVTAAIKGEVKGDKMECDMSGSTALHIASIQVKTLQADLSGKGTLTVESGIAETVSYDISGSGKVHGYGLQASRVLIDVSGAGTVETTALKNLDVSISGSGSISYKGNPAIKKDISGAGTLQAMD